MISEKLKQKLENQQYRLTGNNSAVKICHWTKKSLLDEGVCYKEKFYGIPCHRCCQMTPCLVCCNQCLFCWRDTKHFTDIKIGSHDIDEPKEIIDNCIEKQRELLNGFPGNPKINMKKFKEAQNPASFAISLTGEPTMYPRLSELIKELYKRKICSFLVTNGLFPEAIEKLDKLPVQLYVSLDAPTKQIYKKIDKPLHIDFWERLNKTLDILSSLNTRTVLRITAIKGLNMCNLDDYAYLIKKANPKFVEVKGYMWIGGSRKILKKENMPNHVDVKKFGEKISNLTGLKIIDEKSESNVVLLAEKDWKNRKLKF